MSFLNPGYAPWLLLIALPVVIHLLTRQAARVYALPTFHFLQRSLARQSRLFRLRHLLLLLLRTLLVGLLVFVFLKPIRVAPLSAQTGGRRAAVIILDTSLSMTYRAGGVTSFQRAQIQALKVLEGLPGGHLANIILAGAAPTPVLSQPAADLPALRQALKSAVATQERCDVSASVALAAEQLGRAEAARRELYLLSDFQRTNWADVKFDALPQNTAVVFISTEEATRENAAVTGIRLRPAVPRAGDDVTALVEIWNGTGQIRPLQVTLHTTASAPQTQSVTVPPFATGTAAFPLTFPQPGRYVLSASLPSDALPDDNTRWFVADLQHALTVYLLTDENPNRSPSGSYFIARALNPTPEQPGGIRVLPKRASDLKDADLRAADAVILANVTTMPADRLPAIQKYVQNGGTLLVFLYGNRVADQMQALNKMAGKGEGLAFLPTAPIDVRRQGKGYVTLSEARFESRLLRIFKDPSAADLGRIQFYRFFLTTQPDNRAEVLLKFEDGTPAAARRAFGQGSVLLCNFSPSPTNSDLARQEVFPPLLHEMLKGLASREGERREFTPGNAASTTIAAPKGRVAVLGPDGLNLPVIVDRTGGGVVIERTPRAGIYTITVENREAAALAVNTHPDESDLRTIDPRELQTADAGYAQASTAHRSAFLVGAGDQTAQLEDLTRNRPLWPYFLLAAFAVLLLEQVIAGLGAGRKCTDMAAPDGTPIGRPQERTPTHARRPSER